ncbi:MAG TPA: cytochrome c biogenesis protein CcsA [Solirubrobacteraceae bacterium]
MATAVVLVGLVLLAVLWAPREATQGNIQRIFYLHVPLAIVALGGFVAGGWFGLQHLRTGDRGHDLKSYVAIHMSLIFGVAALITGSIWARGEWGHWWLWDEPTLVSFLIVFLLYATYQPLRFSIEDPERQARYAAVFAVVAGVFVPLNFMAVRTATEKTHPKTLTAGGMPAEVWITFLVGLVAMTLLFVTLWKYEMAAKHTRFEIKRLRRRLTGERGPAAGRSAAPQVTA